MLFRGFIQRLVAEKKCTLPYSYFVFICLISYCGIKNSGKKKKKFEFSLAANILKQSTSKKMPPLKGRKANATSTATQPLTIKLQQEPTPEFASRQVEQDILPRQLEVESQLYYRNLQHSHWHHTSYLL